MRKATTHCYVVLMTAAVLILHPMAAIALDSAPALRPVVFLSGPTQVRFSGVDLASEYIKQ